MKKKVVWLLVSCWMVAALLLASCAPAVVEEEEEKVAPPVKEEEVVVPKEVVVPEKEANIVKWTGKKADGTVVEKMIEKPRYGGVHITAVDVQPPTFDDIFSRRHPNGWAITATNEELITKDWLRGPGGTGEWTAYLSIATSLDVAAGQLAESWELPDPETLVFHVRQGVHWQDKPPLNGREFTADDAVFSLRREWTIGECSTRAAYLVDMKNVANSIYVSPTDKWAVVIKTQPGMNWVIWQRTDNSNTIPREVVEKYGNMMDWKNVVGTGPFTLQEYVGASSLTYVKNPNYWKHDPFFPENQLPYMDGFKILVIPDLSTRVAGLRTGKIDRLYDVQSEDAEQLLKTNPELEWVSYIAGSAPCIFMRNDTKPFDDIRVRRALTMAVNRRELVDEYYGGKAELFMWPVIPLPEFKDMFIPLQELPESCQELYTYNPDKAKQLLVEAGYPQGFKTECLCNLARDIDLLSIVKEYWAKIGVDLKLDVKDNVVMASITNSHLHKAMTIGGNAVAPATAGTAGYMSYERLGAVINYSIVTDPWVEEQYQAVAQAIASEGYMRGRVLNNRESIIYRIEQAWYIPLPAPYYYTLWQPWLKAFYGANQTSYSCNYGYTAYAWIDQELKKAMGY